MPLSSYLFLIDSPTSKTLSRGGGRFSTIDSPKTMSTLKYAGIGPRKTPHDICTRMFNAACELNKLGWTVRSGHAEGADQAWAQGHDQHHREIYLPWHGFNQGQGKGFYVSPDSPALRRIAQLVHPRWDSITQGAQRLMMRNVSIILGPQLDDPVRFVAYWAPSRHVQGGTGNAVSLATHYGIPSYNIAFEDEQEEMTAMVNQFEGV